MAVDETIDFNPKIHRRQAKRKINTISFSDIESPINLQIKDPKEVISAFKKWPLIPFAGTVHGSNQGLLHFFNSARFISSTLGACHEGIKSYLFAPKIAIEKASDPDFEMGDETNEVINKADFLEFIKSLDVKGGYMKLACDIYDEFKANGNAFVEVIHTETLGVKKTSVHIHPTESCAYLCTDKNQPKVIAISPIWTEQYLRDNPPKVVAAFPNYSSTKDKTQRTIIHLKNGKFEWYGRPDWVGSWRSVFEEYQRSDYKIKLAGKRFTGEVFIELEDGDIETEDPLDNEGAVKAGYRNAADRFHANFTAGSDNPQTAIVMTRPLGAKPAFVHEFKPNTNENYFKVMSDQNRRDIIENNSWSERLLGNSVAQGFSHDAFISELKVKDVSVLRKYRQVISQLINAIIGEAVNFHDRSDLEGIAIAFKSSVEEMAEIEKEQEIITNE